MNAEIDVGPYRLADPGTTVALDLRLSWPLAQADDTGGLQPYLTLGPALFLLEPRDAGTLLVPQGEPGAVLGLRVGAGLTWQLDRGATFFGEYRVTRGGADALAPFGGGRAGEVGGYDVLYGVRFRF